MKKKIGFWESLEQYSWTRIRRSALPQIWPWIGVGMVMVIVGASLANKQNSVVGATSWREIIMRAAERGDYVLARKLLTKQQTNETIVEPVLGVESELEEMVYPERAVSRRIAELEKKLADYPESKTIYLMLSSLYGQLGNTEMSSEYREKARVLDPNGSEFK